MKSLLSSILLFRLKNLLVAQAGRFEGINAYADADNPMSFLLRGNKGLFYLGNSIS